MGNADDAGRIGRLLVEARLAACVSVLPVRSTYRCWGEVVEETAPRVAAVLAAVPQELADSDVHFGPAEGPMQVGRLMSLAAIHVTGHLGHVREALERHQMPP